MPTLPRRQFLRNAALSTGALAAAPLLVATGQAYNAEAPPRPAANTYLGGFAAPKLLNVRAAFIGLGARGGTHLENFGRLDGTEIVAVCDLYEDNVDQWVAKSVELGGGKRHKTPARYSGAENAWRQMLTDVKPDVVFIATNWANHAPMAIATMQAGTHAFVEVPIALTPPEMWDIVDTAERTQRHCMMMENVNYGRDELMFLNVCRQGLLGELLHGEAAYIHDLRKQMDEVDRGTGSWRTAHYAHRNGNLYPTHGLGPVAQYMNLARGEDTLESIVSYSTPSVGRAAFAKTHYPADHKWNALEFRGGDLNTSILKTKLGRTIMVQWDETSPRPYSRLNLIQGTRGCMAGFPTRVALEGGVPGATKDHHSWAEGEQLASFRERYEHPLYRRLNDETKSSGHGGMDGIMMVRIVESLRRGEPLDQNLYEGCLWSAVAPLSERSVASGGAPQLFPDFTRGNYRSTVPLEIMA